MVLVPAAGRVGSRRAFSGRPEHPDGCPGRLIYYVLPHFSLTGEPKGDDTRDPVAVASGYAEPEPKLEKWSERKFGESEEYSYIC